MFPATLSPDTASTLALLSESHICDNAYLAGGTALALQLGHRMSVDLDFFSFQPFSSQEIVDKLKKIGDFCISQQTEKTINGVLNKVKFSYFFYSYPLIKDTNKYLAINLASTQDIAAMKLAAICDRGTKKDYIDLYFLLKSYSIEEMFSCYEKKYHLLEANRITILKSLQYFVDADESETPIMVTKVEWEEVKERLKKEVKLLTKKYLA